MSGAYVAKPAVASPLVLPPDWNPIWPFPGPDPPGYPNFPSLLPEDGGGGSPEATKWRVRLTVVTAVSVSTQHPSPEDISWVGFLAQAIAGGFLRDNKDNGIAERVERSYIPDPTFESGIFITDTRQGYTISNLTIKSCSLLGAASFYVNASAYAGTGIALLPSSYPVYVARSISSAKANYIWRLYRDGEVIKRVAGSLVVNSSASVTILIGDEGGHIYQVSEPVGHSEEKNYWAYIDVSGDDYELSETSEHFLDGVLQ